MKKGTIKTTTAFQLLNKVRQGQRTEASHFAVYHVKKNGELYKNPDAYFINLESAKRKALYWESLNEGSKWEVCHTDTGKVIEGWRDPQCVYNTDTYNQSGAVYTVDIYKVAENDYTLIERWGKRNNDGSYPSAHQMESTTSMEGASHLDCLKKAGELVHGKTSNGYLIW